MVIVMSTLKKDLYDLMDFLFYLLWISYFIFRTNFNALVALVSLTVVLHLVTAVESASVDLS